MHEYVQKSISTTLPRRPARVSGLFPGVLSQATMPVKSGAGPSFGSLAAAAFDCAVAWAAAGGAVDWAFACAVAKALVCSPLRVCNCLEIDLPLSTWFS